MRRWRSMLVSWGVIFMLGPYIFGVVELTARFAEHSLWLEGLCYLLAGIVWGAALRRPFRWAARDPVPDNWGAELGLQAAGDSSESRSTSGSV